MCTKFICPFIIQYTWLKRDIVPHTMPPHIREVSIGSPGKFEVRCCESEDSIELHVLPEKDGPGSPTLPSANASMKCEKGDEQNNSRNNASFASKEKRSWVKDLLCVDFLCSSSCSQLIIDSEMDSFSHSEKHISSNGVKSPTP